MAIERESSDDLVEVGRVYSVIEADVVRASLEAAGIRAHVPGVLAANTLSHMAGGLNPNGMKILVPASAADEARELIAAWNESKGRGREDEESDMPDQTPADIWARSAWRAAILTLASTMLFLPLAIYCLRRARREARAVQPADQPHFDRHLARARRTLWIAATVYGAILIMILTAHW
ncbi:MAG: DUF2007 domain-containing protein [Planctomycetes bacterium]|nr:DUF2007 domain-containing protein [Planctomycetota bacterium]